MSHDQIARVERSTVTSISALIYSSTNILGTLQHHNRLEKYAINVNKFRSASIVLALLSLQRILYRLRKNFALPQRVILLGHHTIQLKVMWDHTSALSSMSVRVLVLVWGFSAYCVSGGRILEEQTLESFNKQLYLDLIQQIKYSYNNGLENFQTNCSQELSRFWNNSNFETRAAYLDSFGKVGAGILTGNVIYLGYYDQCIDIGNTDYCLFPFDVTLTTNTTGSVTIPFEFGMCFPSSCDSSDFYKLFFIDSDEVFYNNSYTDVNAMNYTVDVQVSIEYTEPRCPWRDLDWTTSSIIMLTVCVLFIVLVIIGTAVDVLLWFITDIFPNLFLTETELSVTATDLKFCEIKKSINNDKPAGNEDEPFINTKSKLKANQSMAETRCIEFLKDLILSFSLYKTVPVIVNTHQPPNAITSINGMRVISMFWVILAHMFVWAIVRDVTSNIREAIDTVPEHFLYQPVDNGFLAVDNFFVLSGLLMSYLSIREMERHQGKFPFVFFYIHRYLRLSPAYFFALFLNFKVLPYVGSGPFWSLSNVHRCEKYWWTNILYINNFYPTIFSDQCYGLTWYLANDMQFFIIAPIFVLLLYHFWEIGLSMIVGIMLASIAVIGTLAGIDNSHANFFMRSLVNDGTLPMSNFAYTQIYEKPYCRINAFLIGIILGFVLYKKWRVKFSLWIRLCIYIVLWMIAVAFCMTIVFGQYQTWHNHPFNKAENVMYFMFSRTVYSTGIALMIYACHNGFGGIINSFLSWSLWVPLSRLTFMAYLSHPIVLCLIYNTMRFRFIYSDLFLFLLFFAVVVFSYLLALLLAVVVEYPLANVENAIYKFAGVKRRK